MQRIASFLRRPGAAGVAIALVCVPLILASGGAGAFVAFVGLCLYPILDTPRLLLRPSWWLGALRRQRHLGRRIGGQPAIGDSGLDAVT